MRQDIREYFESRIERVTESGCWIWMGSVLTNGYGVVSEGRKQTYAHRTSWTLFRGPIPKGMFVCHHCDLPPCCNPSHLFLGTVQDNHADMMKKGRNPRGEDYNRTLSEADVLAILASTESGLVLAARHKVSPALISAIRHGDRWAHLPRPAVVKTRRRGRVRDIKS